MVGVQHVAQIQRVLLFRGRLFAVDQIKEIRGFAEGRVGLQQAFALPGAMKIGGDDRNARDEPDRFLRWPSMESSSRRIKAAEGGNGRANGMHRRRVFGQGLDDIDDAGGQFAGGGQKGFEFRQFLAFRQMIVVEQVDDFFEGHLAGEFIDVITAINQFPLLALDIA